MATVTLSFPDANLPRVIEALTVTWNQPPTAAGAKEAVRQFVVRTVVDYENRKNQAAAVAAVPPPPDPAIT